MPPSQKKKKYTTDLRRVDDGPVEVLDLLLGAGDVVHVDPAAGVVHQVGAEAQLQGVQGGGA